MVVTPEVVDRRESRIPDASVEEVKEHLLLARARPVFDGYRSRAVIIHDILAKDSASIHYFDQELAIPGGWRNVSRKSIQQAFLQFAADIHAEINRAVEVKTREGDYDGSCGWIRFPSEEREFLTGIPNIVLVRKDTIKQGELVSQQWSIENKKLKPLIQRLGQIVLKR